MSLFDEGLGLDSIDVLELVLEIERSFGVSIGDEQTGMKVLRSVDTIADYITTERAKFRVSSEARPMAVPVDTRNVFTVDLEEWFHVCGVGARSRRRTGIGCRRAWNRRPGRSSICSMPRQVRATFFVVGWVADRYPRLDRGGAAAGHEIGSHGYHHARAYDLGRGRVPRGSPRERPRAGGGRRPARDACSARPSGRSTTGHSGRWRRLVEEGFTRRREHGADEDRRRGHVSAPSSCSSDARRADHSRCRRSSPIGSARSMPMGWGWGLRMSSPRRVLRAIEAVNRAGVPAVLTVHPWELDPNPPRVRLPARLHFAHYFRLGGFRERLRRDPPGAPFGPIGDMAGVSIP